MNKNNKSYVDPFVIVMMSISAVLIGLGGVVRLFNNEFLFGVPQVIVGFVGGILGFIQYRLIKKQGRNSSN
ncbi:hypothetical protein QTL97_16520 [Sporosarcina thermotolerans]|uniref:ATPase F0F1 n=1 Tax=Sporosarcina thermotolerans TaxID=633404 RepID=A0AAW9AC54_9BACL|nr:hypothetical protein [Sporosarcina thermotolerans]MDW0118535.1 hypothetical protein [Sporosarcina thermotolerans]WHT49519.1 hypothetical protein QNH10_08410 [Sporosarcina thermotolerans]